MNCKRCGEGLPENALFCYKCGEKVPENQTEQKGHPFKPVTSESNLERKNSNVLKNRKLMFIIGSTILLIFTSLLIYSMFNSISTFKKLCSKKDYEYAREVFLTKIKGSKKEKEIDGYLKNKINNIFEDYKNDKLEYEEAKIELENMKKIDMHYSDIRIALLKIDDLYSSRIAFEKGNEYLASQDYVNAIAEFNKVISEDKNYQKAQEEIEKYKSVYKEIALKLLDDYIAKNDYSSALNLVNEALLVFKNDDKLLAKKSIYEEKARKQKLETIKAKQEIVVVSTRVIKDWLNGEMIEVVVKNNSNKTVKKYEVGWMAYDKNGYPVKTGWLSPAYLKGGTAERNIQPGETYGRNAGWELKNDNAKKFLACVKRVEYYDGTSWENEYYNYWVDEYLEKPLK